MHGSPNRRPWPKAQPLLRRKSNWACDSTPSAITSMPRLRPISMMVRTIVASLASSGASRTKDWSIFSVPIGNCCRAESEE